LTLHLYEHFRGEKQWRSVELWRDVVKNFYEKKVAEEANKPRKNSEFVEKVFVASEIIFLISLKKKTIRGLTQGPIMDKIMNFGVKQLLEKTKLKSTSLSEDEILNINFSILRDVASYLAKLTENLSIATDIFIPIASE